MTLFRLLLIAIIVTVGVFTIMVVGQQGPNFLTPFFTDILKVGWAGQFNMDFASLLIMCSVWLMWRHHFSPLGLLFGVVIFVGGAPFLSGYLLIVMAKGKPDMTELLLGRARAAGLKDA